MSTFIQLEVSKREILFTPYDAKNFARQNNFEKNDLIITITNLTKRFASFQLKVIAEGIEADQAEPWYSIEPNISAKKPPGDCTQFQFKILRSPIPAYDIKIPLTIKVLSPEIERVLTTEIVLLQILPPKKVLRAYLPIEEFTAYPGDRLKIHALVYNWSRDKKKVSASLNIEPTKDISIDKESWFPKKESELGNSKVIYVEPNNYKKVLFLLVPPETVQTIAGNYKLYLRVSDVDVTDGQSINDDGTYGQIEILPFGYVEFENLGVCKRLAKLPEKLDIQNYLINFELNFNNQSNSNQQIILDTIPNSRLEVIDIIPEEELVLSPTSEEKRFLSVRIKRPLLGQARKEKLRVFPRLIQRPSGETIDKIPLNPKYRDLEIKVKPIIPFFILFVGFFGVLFSLVAMQLFFPKAQHTAPVTSVSLFGNGTVVSGSRDQRLIHWQINQDSLVPNSRRLKFLDVVSEDDKNYTTSKPIRVVQHLPGVSRNQVALGLEDGSIELWQIDPSRKLKRFKTNTNRVFDLEFTNDTQFLFSGHGSGEVYQWPLETNDKSNSAVNKIYLSGDSVFSISISQNSNTNVGLQNLVIIGGQSNRLALWDYRNNKGYNLQYTKNKNLTSKIPLITNSSSFITSLAVTHPMDIESFGDESILVTADSVGTLTVWSLDNIRQCIQDSVVGADLNRTNYSLKRNQSIINYQNCSNTELIIDQWQATEQGIPIRAIQLTTNGCYIASAGDDGRVKLWPLTNSRVRSVSSATKGIELYAFDSEKIDSLDIHLTSRSRKENKDILLIASDAPNNHIKLFRKSFDNDGCQ